MEHLPDDVFEGCLKFLANDGVTIGCLSLCSSGLYGRIKDNAELWKLMCLSRWTSNALLDETHGEYRTEYHRRHNLDHHACKILSQLAEELQHSFKLKDGENENLDQHVDVGKELDHAWPAHTLWTTLLSLGFEIEDVLRIQARQNSTGTYTVHQRLLGFLACKRLRDIQFNKCAFNWTQLRLDNSEETGERMLYLMERYNILLCQVNQTPDEQLKASNEDAAKIISDQLDEIAEKCLQRMKELSFKSNDATAVLRLVSDILVKEYQFRGNTENYYDYRNSLLNHVLDAKKGIPISLCILFACVCRRLKLQTFLVGLPGHVVLGFDAGMGNDDSGHDHGETLYLDVFNTGQILSVEDCKRMVTSHFGVPWDDRFLLPLTTSQVLQRTFCNLKNCHIQSLQYYGLNSQSLFNSELLLHQRYLSSLHGQPKAKASTLVNAMIRDPELRLSPELLRFYGLLSPSFNTMLPLLPLRR